MARAGHVVPIGRVEATSAGEHLLLHRSEVFQCQRGRLGGPHLQTLPRFAGEGSQ